MDEPTVSLARRDQFVALRAEARRDLKLMLAPSAGVGAVLVGVACWRGVDALWPVWSTIGAAVVAMIGIGIWAGFFRGRRAIRAHRNCATDCVITSVHAGTSLNRA